MRETVNTMPPPLTRSARSKPPQPDETTTVQRLSQADNIIPSLDSVISGVSQHDCAPRVAGHVTAVQVPVATQPCAAGPVVDPQVPAAAQQTGSDEQSGLVSPAETKPTKKRRVQAASSEDSSSDESEMDTAPLACPTEPAGPPENPWSVAGSQARQRRQTAHKAGTDHRPKPAQKSAPTGGQRKRSFHALIQFAGPAKEAMRTIASIDKSGKTRIMEVYARPKDIFFGVPDQDTLVKLLEHEHCKLVPGSKEPTLCLLLCGVPRSVEPDMLVGEYGILSAQRISNRAGETRFMLVQLNRKHTVGEPIDLGVMGNYSTRRPYVFPSYCGKCGKFDHRTSNCKVAQICTRCAQSGHLRKDCANNPECTACGLNHQVGHRDCAPRRAVWEKLNPVPAAQVGVQSGQPPAQSTPKKQIIASKAHREAQPPPPPRKPQHGDEENAPPPARDSNNYPAMPEPTQVQAKPIRVKKPCAVTVVSRKLEEAVPRGPAPKPATATSAVTTSTAPATPPVVNTPPETTDTTSKNTTTLAEIIASVTKILQQIENTPGLHLAALLQTIMSVIVGFQSHNGSTA